MNEEQINLLWNFYLKCIYEDIFCLSINGKSFILESEACIHEVINAILLAPKEVQEYRLKQAEKYMH